MEIFKCYFNGTYRLDKMVVIILCDIHYSVHCSNVNTGTNKLKIRITWITFKKYGMNLCSSLQGKFDIVLFFKCTGCL